MSHGKRPIKLIALLAVAHAVASALLWMWALGVSMGLGFKDRAAWTVLDHLQAAVVPALAFTLTAPGRLFLEAGAGWPWVVIPWLLNSVLWAMVLAAIWSFVPRRRNAT